MLLENRVAMILKTQTEIERNRAIVQDGLKG